MDEQTKNIIENLSRRVSELEIKNDFFMKIDRYLLSRHVQVSDLKNFQFGLSHGTKFGTSTSQKIGFWNTTPVIQQASPAANSAAIIAALKTIGIFGP